MIRALVLLAILATPLAAQRTTAEQLREAQTLYDQLELERAARALRLMLSPQWTAPVETPQRVEATKLLGATLVLMGRADSASAHFRAALRLDPFTELDADEFTPAQIGAFARARRQVFVVGVRPVAPSRVDPRTDRIRFAYATTHSAAIRADLRRGDSVLARFEAAGEGPAEIVWDGLAAGRLAPAGRYELRVRAASRLLERTDSASTYFDLRPDVAALEDTLPPILDLLPERKPGSAGAVELGKGLAVAGGVFVVAGPMAGSALGDEDFAKPAVVAVAAIAAGIVSFLAAQKQREIPANVTANRDRQDARRVANDSVRARNAARVAATHFVITPAAGVGP